MAGMKDTLGDTLFDYKEPAKATGTNAEHLSRVSTKIAPAILEFCSTRVGKEFHMELLVEFVREKIGIAPDSPSRILRALRQSKDLDYIVVNRRASLYRITSFYEREE